MPNLINDESVSIKEYLESLYTKHLTNASGISSVSGSPVLGGYFCNIQGHTGDTLIDANAVSARIYLDTYNNTNSFGSSFRGRRFRGYADNPSGVLKDDVLLQLVGDGHHGSGISNAAASIVFFAAENFLSGQHGSYIKFRTTPNGTDTQLERAIITEDGRVGINNYTPYYTLDISGNANFTEGVLVNGLNIGTGNFQNLSGFLSSKLESTGSYLLSQVGAAGYSITNPNNYSNSGNLYATGSFIENQLISFSGDFLASEAKFIQLSGNLIQTGINLIGQTTSLSGDVSVIHSNLAQTGINILNKIISLSGDYLVDVGNLTQTGISLLNKINGTGNFYRIENINNYSTSGNLALTGSNLLTNDTIISGKLLSLSGDLLSSGANLLVRDQLLSGNIISTGITLLNQINSLSGDFLASGNRYIQLSGSLAYTGVNLINIINSLSGSFNNTGINLQTQVTNIGNGTGNFYRIENVNNYANSGNLALTGFNLFANDTIISGKLLSLSGDLVSSGFNLLARNQVLSGNVINTGIALINQIVSLSGDIQSSGANLLNRFGILSGNLVASGQTLLNSDSIISGNLFTTGSNLLVNDTVLSGKLLSLSGDLLSSGANLFARINILSGNVVSTGISILNQIGSLSGDFLSSGSRLIQLSGNLYQTGANLFVNDTVLSGKIISLSGDLQSTGINLFSRQQLLSGNLIQTGINILGQITSLSGDLLASGSNINSKISIVSGLATNQITGISITGSNSLIGLFGISQGNNITLTQIGNTGLIIAGAAGAGEANTASNLGVGIGIFNQKVGADLQLNSITAGTGMSISLSGNSISINSTVVGGGGGGSDFPTGLSTVSIDLLKVTGSQESLNSNYNSVYMENLAQRGILSYANNRGVGKMIQNTFALETIHNFSPNTTTTMNVLGTTATSAGTLSHPTTFYDITGFGYGTNFATAAAGGPAGIQSATMPFYLTSGTTGVGAGFFYSTQFQFNDRSGLYPTGSGVTTGINFFAGMTNAASVILSTTSAWNTAATLGFQFVRQSGASGRNDNTIKFVSKTNGATAPFYIQETNCPFVTTENYAAYLYGRNDFRNGVYWMIKRLGENTIYSGEFTGSATNLPVVSSSAQILLKPSIGMNFIGAGTMSARNLKLKGLYCETV